MAAKPATKSATFQRIAEATSMSRKQVATFFDELGKLIKNELGKKGPGVFNVPGLLKIKRVEKPATKARQGRNPATGETIQIPAKKVVKFRVAKAAKDAILGAKK